MPVFRGGMESFLDYFAPISTLCQCAIGRFTLLSDKIQATWFLHDLWCREAYVPRSSTVVSSGTFVVVMLEAMLDQKAHLGQAVG